MFIASEHGRKHTHTHMLADKPEVTALPINRDENNTNVSHQVPGGAASMEMYVSTYILSINA